jgi:hypothetical protein
MTSEEILSLASSWIAHQSGYDDVVDKMYDLLYDDPENARLVIQEMNSREISEKVTANLAAGPLEDLLALPGDSFIDRIEAKAKQEPKFNYLLGGVWRSSMKPIIWERIEKVRNKVW